MAKVELEGESCELRLLLDVLGSPHSTGPTPMSTGRTKGRSWLIGPWREHGRGHPRWRGTMEASDEGRMLGDGRRYNRQVVASRWPDACSARPAGVENLWHKESFREP